MLDSNALRLLHISRYITLEHVTRSKRFHCVKVYQKKVFSFHVQLIAVSQLNPDNRSRDFLLSLSILFGASNQNRDMSIKKTLRRGDAKAERVDERMSIRVGQRVNSMVAADPIRRMKGSGAAHRF